MLAAECQSTDSIIRQATGSTELRRASVVKRVNPFITVILEIGVKVVEVKSRTVTEFVVERTAKSVASAFVTVLSQVHAVVIWDREARIGLRLNVVNTAAVVIVASGKQRTKALLRAKTLADRTGQEADVTRIDDRCE